MEVQDKTKESTWRKKLKRLFFETSIEVLLGVIIVGAVSGGLFYRNRVARSGEIPIAFSEGEQIKKDFNKAGKPMPALTGAHTFMNDVPMKVFESSNIAYALGNSHVVFATELRTRVDANFQTHPLISTYAEETPGVMDAAMG